MSDTFSSGASTASSSGDRIDGVDERVPAYVVYGLLFIAPFTSGLTGLIGGVLAHVLKGPGVSIAQSHIRFQIKIFWISIMMMLPLVVGLLVGLTLFFTQLAAGVDVSQLDAPIWVIPAFALIGLLAAASWLWLLGASIFGLVRLAGNRPIGRDYA